MPDFDKAMVFLVPAVYATAYLPGCSRIIWPALMAASAALKLIGALKLVPAPLPGAVGVTWSTLEAVRLLVTVPQPVTSPAAWACAARNQAARPPMRKVVRMKCLS